MDRLRRLSEFWNWLPAYRAVAETEHVRTAAEQLRVSPSALSRSIGLLEDSVGEQLFEREGRGIKLNPAGRAFLNSLRAAMRLVDEGLASVEASSFVGSAHIAAPDDLTHALWPGIVALRQEHSALKIHVRSVPPTELNALLSQGQLDLAFSDRPIPDEEIEIELFVEMTNRIFCSPDHPIASMTDVTATDVLEFPFAAGVDDDGALVDRWPVDVRRIVGVYVNRLQGALEAALFGGMMSVLPVHIAKSYVDGGLLVAVDVDLIPPSKFYALRRRQLIEDDTNAQILDVLRENSPAK